MAKNSINKYFPDFNFYRIVKQLIFGILIASPAYILVYYKTLFIATKSNHLVSILEASKNNLEEKKAGKTRCINVLQQDGVFTTQNTKCVFHDLDRMNDSCIKNWIPNGCSMHYYTKLELSQCLAGRQKKKIKYLFFVGDSRIRNIFNSVMQIIGNFTLPEKYHIPKSFFFEEENTNATFIWRETLNEEFLQDLREIRITTNHHKTLLVIGITLHVIKYFKHSKNGLKNFELILKNAKENLHLLGKKNRVIWYLQPPRKIYTDSSTDENGLNSEIDEYNNSAIKILNGTSVKIWKSSIFIGNHSMEDYKDKIHLSGYANYSLAQILFNVFCNKDMRIEGKKGLCCTA